MRLRSSLSLMVGIAVVAALPLLSVATLPPPERPYNLLMLLPACSISHRNVFMPLAKALTERGHKITMITPFDAPDNNPHITYINHGLGFDREKTNMFEIRDDLNLLFDLFIRELPRLARGLYMVPSVKEVYDNRKQFDLTFIDWSFNEIAYPFVHEQPFVMVATAGINTYRSAIQGNFLNPAYVSCSVMNFKRPLSIVDRVKNIICQVQFPLGWKIFAIRPLQKEIDEHFPELPPLEDIERNASLTLYNSHFTLDMPIPMLPNQVEVGGMHCRPGNPLPKNINDFVSGDQSVIYFSLGSVVTSKSMQSKYQAIFVSVFAKLPYKVLWKFEASKTDISHNVLIQEWMPQQDVLAHPNVKLFISHCGLLSTQEAMYHSKPVLGLPVFADQPKNAKIMQDKGISRTIQWEDLTEDILVQEITELMTNPSYREAIGQISKTFRDQPQSPVDRAVFWTEYVIRHGGAPHLRSPELDLTWTQLLHLDILLMVHLLLYILYRVGRKLMALCFGTNRNNGKPKQH